MKNVNFQGKYEKIKKDSFGKKVRETKFLPLKPAERFGFLFSHEAFGLNDATHETNSYERANFSLSDGAKQNSMRSVVFELSFI